MTLRRLCLAAFAFAFAASSSTAVEVITTSVGLEARRARLASYKQALTLRVQKLAIAQEQVTSLAKSDDVIAGYRALGLSSTVNLANVPPSRLPILLPSLAKLAQLPQ